MIRRVVKGAAKIVRVGDKIAAVATPIARAVGMDCVDKATGKLKPDSPCSKRKQWLNGES